MKRLAAVFLALALLLLAGGGLVVFLRANRLPTWEAQRPQPPGLFVGIDGLVSAPDQPGAVFSVLEGGKAYVYASSDGGESWASLADTLQRSLLSHLAVSAVEGGERTLVVSDGESLHVSRDTGRTWEEATQGLPSEPLVEAIAIAPRDRAQMVVVLQDDGEVYASRDGGRTWTKASGLQGLAASVYLDARSYLQTDKGLFVSEDGGRVWTLLSPHGSLPGIAKIRVHPSQPELLWVQSHTGGAARVFRSRDAGASWSEIAGTREADTFEIDPEAEDRLFVAVGGVVKVTSDAGVTWRALSERTLAPDGLLFDGQLLYAWSMTDTAIHTLSIDAALAPR